MTVEIELARDCDGADVLQALSAQGLDGELAYGGRYVVVHAEADEQVVHALDEWLSSRGLPFVPLRVDEHCYAVTPPLG